MNFVFNQMDGNIGPTPSITPVYIGERSKPLRIMSHAGFFVGMGNPTTDLFGGASSIAQIGHDRRGVSPGCSQSSR